MSSESETPSERFPRAAELDLPEEMDGWRDMYPSYFLFDRTNERSAHEWEQTWFLDLATTEPLLPWDVTISAEAWQIGWSQNTSRVLPFPDAAGIEIRLIGGYAYTTEFSITDDQRRKERAERFEDRTAYWLDHFDDLYENTWKPHVADICETVKNLPVPDTLPEYAPDHVVHESTGRTQTMDVIESYNRLVELALEGWQRHFEFLGLSYLTYLEFYEFCTDEFPDIPDTNVVSMVSAVDADIYRPDEELNTLAELAAALGDPVTSILTGSDTPDEKRAALVDTPAGREFLEAFDDAADPWFYTSYGDGFHSYHGCWLDDLEAPFDYLAEKITHLQNGESIGRDYEGLEAEARELADEYRYYLPTEEKQREFDALYEQCLTVYEYAEDHQFWIEHHLNSSVTRKMREFGALLVEHDFLDAPDDVFYFTRTEVQELLGELCATWAAGPKTHTPTVWADRAANRAEIFEAAQAWDPDPALGAVPDAIDDPLLRMLYGITMDTVEDWLDTDDSSAEGDTVIDGFAASAGTVEGHARVVSTVEDVTELEAGELLVCPLTNPSWASTFSRVRGAVTDFGGITSHAAVVCREYEIPSVTGTNTATDQIQTGDRIRIDGEQGEVHILERADS